MRIALENLSYEFPRDHVREFHEKFALADFLRLPNHRISLKLMIDGTPSAPFSAATLAPPGL